MQREQGTWFYEYAGLRIASEMEIPEWRVFARACDGQDPDVSIFLNAASEPLSPPPPPAITRDAYTFYMPQVGIYSVRNGREIFMTPLYGAGARELRLFLLGAAWGVLCYQRGILLLHASAVRVGQAALAFCGPSGAGKSSLAAALFARGMPLLSDDLCRVEFAANGSALVYPSAPRLKLWSDALARFQSDAPDKERDYFRAEKYQVPLSALQDFAPVPLRAIYLLQWGDLQITPLRGIKTLHRLVQFATYREDVPLKLDIVSEYWARMAELARRVSVFLLSRPRGWEALDDTLARLELSDQSETGLPTRT